VSIRPPLWQWARAALKGDRARHGRIVHVLTPNWTFSQATVFFVIQLQPQGCPPPTRLSPGKVVTERSAIADLSFPWGDWAEHLMTAQGVEFGNGTYEAYRISS
jgi:hypothetical protein